MEQGPGARRQEEPCLNVVSRPGARFSVPGEMRLDLPHDGRRRLQLGEQGENLLVALVEQAPDDLGLGRFRLALVLVLDGFEQVADQAERQLRGGQGDELRVARADLLGESFLPALAVPALLPVPAPRRLELVLQPFVVGLRSQHDVLVLAAPRVQGSDLLA